MVWLVFQTIFGIVDAFLACHEQSASMLCLAFNVIVIIIMVTPNA